MTPDGWGPDVSDSVRAGRRDPRGSGTGARQAGAAAAGLLYGWAERGEPAQKGRKHFFLFIQKGFEPNSSPHL